jgi:tetratricopeptide (TPR) repeat protein
LAALGSFAFLLFTLHSAAQTSSQREPLRSGEPAPAAQDSTAPAARDSAAPAADRAEVQREAGERFRRGLELYNDGDPSLALVEFERAYALVPNYRVLYNIGQVSVQLGRYARARQAFERYLSEGNAEIPAERRQAVETDLTMLARRTAFLTLSVEPAGAEVRVDDALVGRAPLTERILVDAGERRIRIRKPGFEDRSERVVLAGGDEQRLSFKLDALPQRTLIVERRVEARSGAEARQQRRKALLIAGWAGTGALTAGAVIFGALGAGAARDLDDLRQQRTSRGELDEQRSKAKTRFVAADVLGATALALGGTTLYFSLKRQRDEAATSASRSLSAHAGGSAEHASARGPQARANEPTRQRDCSPRTLGLRLGPGYVTLESSF